MRGTLTTFKNWFLNMLSDVLMVYVLMILCLQEKKKKWAECGVVEAWVGRQYTLFFQWGVSLHHQKSLVQTKDIKSMETVVQASPQ